MTFSGLLTLTVVLEKYGSLSKSDLKVNAKATIVVINEDASLQDIYETWVNCIKERLV